MKTRDIMIKGQIIDMVVSPNSLVFTLMHVSHGAIKSKIPEIRLLKVWE